MDFGIVFGFFDNLRIFGTFLHAFGPILGSSILTRRDGSIREVRKPQKPQKSREPCFRSLDFGITPHKKQGVGVCRSRRGFIFLKKQGLGI